MRQPFRQVGARIEASDYYKMMHYYEVTINCGVLAGCDYPLMDCFKKSTVDIHLVVLASKL